MKKALLGFLVLMLVGSFQVFAEEGTKPIQISLINPIQIFNEDTSICGFRLNLICGVNDNVTGFDLGLGNVVKGNFKGVQWGAVNYVEGNASGWMDASITNIVKGEFTGFQSAWIYNYAGKVTSGLQFGLINNTDDLNGVQIGLLNFNGKGEPMGFFPIVNWSF